MYKFRKVIVVLSCFVGLIVLITVLSQFSWFPKAVNVQSGEQVTPVAEMDKAEVSPVFQSGSYQLQGEKGKIGLLSPGGYKVNMPNKYMWHIWKQGEPLTGKKFRVEAVSVTTGEKKQVLLQNNALVGEMNWPGKVPMNGADAGFPAMMRFDNPGVWRLDAFIDERAVGSITVEVK
ncbi:hypothetical protein QFZ77_001228 [Paenibacillus sp. V4I3]|uniref:hypothetical protein n=1 Tax=unclassified Paenibacillus TaxID=185978 RepID=UPI002782C230|nr:MULTISPECIES: hypothetical protein [unclassified Paenibacillus]MDQ0872569.1 hypothetical protein [Paenibacillus sp. V4I3]MDQ0891545.1 hypothetical protein [Paenibacillus sp. V4I9]